MIQVSKMAKIQAVSVRDIALKAGYSPMTVSRALRNSPKVNSETRLKIQATADRLGYRQNPLVSANMAGIRARKSITYQATIGIVHETPVGGEWVGSQKIIAAAIRRAEERGFTVDFFDLADSNVSTNDLGRLLRSRGIQGVIQTPMLRDFREYPIDFSELTVVVCNSGTLPQKFHRVCHDHYGNMDMLLKRIHELGYKRIGLLITKELDSHLNHLSTSRYLAFQQTEKLPRLPIFMPGRREDYRAEDFQKWFEKNRPEIVITTCEPIFRNGFFEDAGLEIPRDLAVVKVNINRNTKNVSGIDEESENVGITAIDILAQLLFQNEQGLPQKPISALVPGKWVEAGTAPKREAG